MKNVLFICDLFSDGGLENRIIEQVHILKKSHINAFLLCRNFNQKHSKSFVAASGSLIFNSSPSHTLCQDILHDTESIRSFCTKYNIDFIDCHPFWCALPAVIAANQENIPISFTLHGQLSGDIFITGQQLTAQALYHTAMSYGFDQIFAVAEYLTKIYSYIPNIHILRNGLSLDSFANRPFMDTRKVAIASRLDKPKTELITNFLPKLHKLESINQIDIYGSGSDSAYLQQFIKTNKLDNKVRLCGWTNDLSKTITKKQYMIVFGMGKVILDAIKTSTPAGVLGYGGFAGLINHDNLINFSKNNLTEWTDNGNLATELQSLFKNPDDYIFKKDELSIFDADKIWQDYYKTITSIRYHKKITIDKIHNVISGHLKSDTFSDQNVFLECIRLLSDGNQSISPRFFYNTFQFQFDQIEILKKENRDLININEKKFLNKIKKRLKIK